jgi:apolipoprotein N-acyltransferase
MVQSASLFGSYFISFLILAVNGLLAFAILYRPVWRRALPCVAVAAAMVLSNLLIGLGISASPTPTRETVKMAVVQGNVNSHEKWGPESLEITKRVYGEKTRRASEEGAEIVVWPETAFPYKLNRNPSLRQYVSSLARSCDVTLIIGALYTDDDGLDYNALYLIHPDGTIEEDNYAKRHLVPFGEYVPMREVIMTLIPPLANLSALDTELTPGADSALFETEWGKIGGLICFDSIYESLALDSARDGAGVLVLSSNDSWFFDSAAVYQHNGQAVLRAIENGRAVVRAANTGISSIITEKGEIMEHIPPLVDGQITAEVSLSSQKTLYTYIGDTFVLLAAIAFHAPFILSIFRYIQSKCKKELSH